MSVEILRRALATGDAQTARRAIHACGECLREARAGDPTAMWAALLPLASHASPTVRQALSDSIELLGAEIREMLAKAGREEHAKCAALSRRGAATGQPREGIRLAIDGRATASGRTGIEVNGTRREMQDSKFLVVLRGIVAREREADAWSSRDALGIGEDRAATTRVREAFEGLVPVGFDVLEGDRRGNFRLNPAVVVEGVDWRALAEHPDVRVPKLAIEMVKRARA